MPPRLTEIRIDELTWTSATRIRRQEWRVALDDLLADHSLGGEGDHALRLSVKLDGTLTVLEANTDDGAVFARVELARPQLEIHVEEYLGVCRRMAASDAGEASAHFEALDIAKRITHDEAAETVQRLCAPLGLDHSTARRLFTLIVTLHVDTTALAL